MGSLHCTAYSYTVSYPVYTPHLGNWVMTYPDISIHPAQSESDRGLGLGLGMAGGVHHSLFPPKKKRVYANIPIYREMYMTDTLDIEKDVPLTTKIRRYTYPYKDMDVGDSFFVADGKLPTINNANYRASKALGWKFSARKQDGGIRVWRIL